VPARGWLVVPRIELLYASEKFGSKQLLDKEQDEEIQSDTETNKRLQAWQEVRGE
jgi:hypothetical protein